MLLGWKAFKSEVLAFPKGAHDDQVDALIQLLENVQEFSYTKSKYETFQQIKRSGMRQLLKAGFKPIKNN